jgi:hypothetical protein
MDKLFRNRPNCFARATGGTSISEKKKLPGKSEFAGRRRTATRKSGFSVAAGTTGGEFSIAQVPTIRVRRDKPLILQFQVPQLAGQISGFGGWLTSDKEIVVDIDFGESHRVQLDRAIFPNWGKFGSLWIADTDKTLTVEVSIRTKENTKVAIYGSLCGIVDHRHLKSALESKPQLLKNIYQIAPEAIFVNRTGIWTLNQKATLETMGITLKSCNRCARFLPINTGDERAHLSFSNHCVATHRRPCTHSNFGKLQNLETKQTLKLDYGFQLECRFCKKFEVNAAHNPRRTAGQMKEDGARRRALEFLLTELYGTSPQLMFRHENDGLELADYIWDKFDKTCFNCKEPISSVRSMHLDHTRPLALLWPLDRAATCLCGPCNSQKRDRSPSEFYDASQLKKLSAITGLSLEVLTAPGPNKKALELLFSRLEWFFKDFMSRPELVKEREGKVTGALLVKALHKVALSSSENYPNLVSLYEARQTRPTSKET